VSWTSRRIVSAGSGNKQQIGRRKLYV